MFSKKSILSSIFIVILLGFFVVSAEEEEDEELSELFIKFFVGVCIGVCQENQSCNFFLTIFTLVGILIFTIAWCCGADCPTCKRSDAGYVGGYAATRAYYRS